MNDYACKICGLLNTKEEKDKHDGKCYCGGELEEQLNK